MTTHPYPIFTPHCDLDPIDEIRNGLHATAESRLYADVGGKPCLVEEIGTLGPMVCAEDISANYIRMSMMSAVANDCRALLWWCAYDQDHLTQAPYDWNSVERELGLFRKDRQAKPITKVFKEFDSSLREYRNFRSVLQKRFVCSRKVRTTGALPFPLLFLPNRLDSTWNFSASTRS